MSLSEKSFQEITELSRVFCEECFSDNYEENSSKKKLDELVKLITPDKNDLLKELILVFIERGAEKAFLRQALYNTSKGQKATYGITLEGDFESILTSLGEQYTNENDKEAFCQISKHLMSEINDLSVELDVTTLQTYNFTDAVYKLRTENYYSALDASKNNFKKETEKIIKSIRRTEKDTQKSHITTLGIFASIVLSFNTVASFYASTIGALTQANLYKILFVILAIGLILVNVLVGLFHYLEIAKTYNFDAEEKKISIKEIFRSIRSFWPFWITDAIIILLLVLLIVFGNTDAITRADKIIDATPTSAVTANSSLNNP